MSSQQGDKIERGTTDLGLSFIRLSRNENQSSVLIYEFGAHVAEWKDTHGKSRLYMSEKAVLNGTKAIRGGIPICFPQFGKLGSYPQQHGFARNTVWKVVSTEESDTSGEIVAVFELSDSMVSWKSSDGKQTPYVARLKVALHENGTLSCSMTVRNPSLVDSFQFTTALHAYFSVSDATTAKVEGLHELEYIDQIATQPSKQLVIQKDPLVEFHGEVDRIYKQIPSKMVILDNSSQKTVIQVQRFYDAVVWNPYIEKTKTLTDMPEDAWKRFICIEAACASKPIVVGPGQEWVGVLTLE